jgi:hypothetical protein
MGVFECSKSIIKHMTFMVGLIFLVDSAFILQSQTQPCGVSPMAKRIITGESKGAPGRNWPIIKLSGTDQVNGRTRIILELLFSPGTKPEWYTSIDNGITWLRLGSDPCTSIYQIDEPAPCYRSKASADILYRSPDEPWTSDLMISTDGGQQWLRYSPAMTGYGRVRQFEFMESSPKSRGRIYGLIKTMESDKHKVSVSNDYGKTFRQMGQVLTYVVESRADVNILFGLRWSRDDTSQRMMMISRDGGRTWTDKPASEAVCSPFYRDAKLPGVRSWRESKEDVLFIHPNPIYQIETDPGDKEIIYMLSFSGLYRSSDGGNSFVLLPLANNRILSINAIAVDPSDGSHIFASVDARHLFVTADKGCHWQEINLPKK